MAKLYAAVAACSIAASSIVLDFLPVHAELVRGRKRPPHPSNNLFQRQKRNKQREKEVGVDYSHTWRRRKPNRMDWVADLTAWIDGNPADAFALALPNRKYPACAYRIEE